VDYSIFLPTAASTYPDSVAVVYRGESMTYAELDGLVNRLARRFVERGAAEQPIAWIAYNEPLVVALAFAIARAGAVGIPINPRLIAPEKAYILAHSGAGTLVVDATVVDEGRAHLAEQPALERLFVVSDGDGTTGLETLAGLADGADGSDLDLGIDDDAIAVTYYTSGTTGRPKGALRTHRANIWNSIGCSLGVSRRADDIELYNLPIFGIGFLQHIPPMCLAGGTIVLDRIFDAERAWRILEEQRVTVTFFAPTMLASMLEVEGHERFDLSALRLIFVAYEFPRRLRERALARFGDIFVNLYGLTEGQLFGTKLGEFAADPTSCGKPMGLLRRRIVDDEGLGVAQGEVGEIALKGPAIMSGYRDMPEETAAALRDGWLHTGDLGYLDAAGNLHFAGRKKEIVKSGGFNVDPTEVENVLLDLEGVREAAIVGEPHEHWGEAVVGFVVVAPGGPGEDELREHCRERMAGFKIPKRFVFLDALPKNPTGKVERGKLRELCARSD